MMLLIPRHKKSRSGSPNRHDKHDTTSQDLRRKNSSSNATTTDESDRYGSNPMITEYTTKEAPDVVTLDVKSDISRSQHSRQSTYINNDDTVEAGHETEILCTQVTLLLKVPTSNNARNAT